METDIQIKSCIFFKVVQEYERAVVFRLGRLPKGGDKGPGERLWTWKGPTKQSLLVFSSSHFLIAKEF